MGETFWLLVEVDRHCDDQFTLFQTEADALLAAGEFAKQYGEKLQDWKRFPKNPAATERWFTSGEDGPGCRIVRLTALPARVRPLSEEARRETV